MRYKDKYFEVLDQILYYFNPCYQDQLKIALMKCFSEIDDKKAKIILHKYQERGQVLLSDDGWALTKGKYEEITGDTRNSGIDTMQLLRLNYMGHIIANECDLRMVHCLWVLIDFLPASLDFSVSSKPFQVSFMSKNRLYQVIYIPQDEEDRKIQMLNLLPYYQFQKEREFDDTEESEESKKEYLEYLENTKNSHIRLAILENEKHAWKIPQGIGFKYICALDLNSKRGYKIIEKRENQW